jgi:hypothetical protein
MTLIVAGTLDEEAIGFLQRALNALGRGGPGHELLAVDRRLGKRTRAALTRFLATRGAAGETRLLCAIAALRGAR